MALERLCFEELSETPVLCQPPEHTFIYDEGHLFNEKLHGQVDFFSVGACNVNDIQAVVERFLKTRRAFDMYSLMMSAHFPDTASIDVAFLATDFQFREHYFLKKYRVSNFDSWLVMPKFDSNPYFCGVFRQHDLPEESRGDFYCVILADRRGLYAEVRPVDGKSLDEVADSVNAESHRTRVARRIVRIYHGASVELCAEIAEKIKEFVKSPEILADYEAALSRNV